MKKVLLFATVALLVSTATFAEAGKGKKKKKAKSSCCSKASKSCHKDEKTAKM